MTGLSLFQAYNTVDTEKELHSAMIHTGHHHYHHIIIGRTLSVRQDPVGSQRQLPELWILQSELGSGLSCLKLFLEPLRLTGARDAGNLGVLFAIT